MTKFVLRSTASAVPDFDELVRQHARELTDHAAHMVLVGVAETAKKEVDEHVAEEARVSTLMSEENDPSKKAELARKVSFVKGKRLQAQEISKSAQAYPAPQVPDVIDQSVRRTKNADGTTTFEPDYEIVDSIPVSPGDEAGLRFRKNELLAGIAQAEVEAVGRVYPTGKWRASAFRRSDINESDSRRRVEIYESANKKHHEECLAANKESSERHKIYSKKLAEYEALDDKEKKKAGEPEIPEPVVFPDPPKKEDLEEAVAAGRSKEDSRFAAEHDARLESVDMIKRFAADRMSEIEDLTEENAHLWVLPKFPE